MKHRWVAVAAVAIFSGAVLLVLLQGPRRIAGEGVMYGHLWCMGIRFDSGEAYPVSRWPQGFQAQRSPGNNTGGVVTDASGAIVLREGQRIAVEATLSHGGGDTPCSYTEIVSVLSFQPIATASPGS